MVLPTNPLLSIPQRGKLLVLVSRVELDKVDNLLRGPIDLGVNSYRHNVPLRFQRYSLMEIIRDADTWSRQRWTNIRFYNVLKIEWVRKLELVLLDSTNMIPLVSLWELLYYVHLRGQHPMCPLFPLINYLEEGTNEAQNPT